MMKTRFFGLGLVVGMAMVLSQCYYDNEEDLYQNFGDTEDCVTDSLSYAAEIEPIIRTNCAVSGCHVAPTLQSGLDLSNFNDVKAIAENGQLVGRITASTGPIMPQSGPLPDCEIEKITAWVNQGALEN